MMDTDIIIPPRNGHDLENNHDQLLPISEKVVETANGGLEIEGLIENFENTTRLNDHQALDCAHEVIEESELLSDAVHAPKPKEPQVKGSNNSKPVKDTGKPRNGKTLNPRYATTSDLSKSRDEKYVVKSSIVSNGAGASESRSRIKSKSFNESGKTKPLKRDQPEETLQPSASITGEEAKPRKMGALPAYDFSFKCDERAERRKVFYSKLEEKIQAKEEEKNNLQAKSKETQDAEIKMLRKSLGFKATPMPSFYQEPPPPKLELKKIPTTRAKSPKLGRRKNSYAAESEENDALGAPLGRLSLDEKLSQEYHPKLPSEKTQPTAHVKKPMRKSLPKLPSEKTKLSPYDRKKVISEKTSSKGTGEQPNNSSEKMVAACDEQKGEIETTAEAIIDSSNTVGELVVEAQEETAVL